MRKAAIAAMLLLTLSACASEQGLHRFDAGRTGPDEFTVLPSRPLEMPASFAALPPPSPGRTNLADPNPLGDAIAALGGSQAAGFAGGVPARDIALVTAAGRNGVDPAIRATLAQEDADFRRRALLAASFNILGRDRYFQAYARQALDAFAELIRFRNLGVQVPSAPPAE